LGKIIGIGGVFFKTKDVEKLKQWYFDNLGLEPDNEGYIYFKWAKQIQTKKAYTLWGPFKEDTKYFEPSPHPFMVNFVVDDLESVLADLREKGVEVIDKIAEHEEGKFGWFMDPEGTKIELWEPPK
jgi:predicted enzyme related to lactoylglutathione lyase